MTVNNCDIKISLNKNKELSNADMDIVFDKQNNIVTSLGKVVYGIDIHDDLVSGYLQPDTIMKKKYYDGPYKEAVLSLVKEAYNEHVSLFNYKDMYHAYNNCTKKVNSYL